MVKKILLLLVLLVIVLVLFGVGVPYIVRRMYIDPATCEMKKFPVTLSFLTKEIGVNLNEEFSLNLGQTARLKGTTYSVTLDRYVDSVCLMERDGPLACDWGCEEASISETYNGTDVTDRYSTIDKSKADPYTLRYFGTSKFGLGYAKVKIVDSYKHCKDQASTDTQNTCWRVYAIEQASPVFCDEISTPSYLESCIDYFIKNSFTSKYPEYCESYKDSSYCKRIDSTHY